MKTINYLNRGTKPLSLTPITLASMVGLRLVNDIVFFSFVETVVLKVHNLT